jgi:hypothetical protein
LCIDRISASGNKALVDSIVEDEGMPPLKKEMPWHTHLAASQRWIPSPDSLTATLMLVFFSKMGQCKLRAYKEDFAFPRCKKFTE